MGSRRTCCWTRRTIHLLSSMRRCAWGFMASYEHKSLRPFQACMSAHTVLLCIQMCSSTVWSFCDEMTKSIHLFPETYTCLEHIRVYNMIVATQVTHNLGDINEEVSRVVEHRRRAMSETNINGPPQEPHVMSSVGIALPDMMPSSPSMHSVVAPQVVREPLQMDIGSSSIS